MSNTFSQLSSKVESFLSEKIQEILTIVQHDPGSTKSPFVMIPSPEDVDMSQSEAARIVAVTSNEFAKASRLAGMCRAQLKLSEGKYKHKYKTSLGKPAKNQDERESNAQSDSADEYNDFIIVAALCELAESWEAACRIASESSRRILTTVESMNTAEKRGHTVSSRSDYTSQW